MTGPFLFSIPKYLTLLDYAALPRAVQEILFDGITYDSTEHLIGRLSIAILTDTRFKGPARTQRRKSYERVNHLFVQINLPSTAFEILEVYPHTTLAPGLKTPEVEVGVSVEPITGKFSVSGTLKNLIRGDRHHIIESHGPRICQWTFQKGYLQDNLLFHLDLLLRRCEKDTQAAALICEARAQERGRLIRSSRRRVLIEGEPHPGAG